MSKKPKTDEDEDRKHTSAMVATSFAGRAEELEEPEARCKDCCLGHRGLLAKWRNYMVGGAQFIYYFARCTRPVCTVRSTVYLPCFHCLFIALRRSSDHQAVHVITEPVHLIVTWENFVA